MSDIRERAELVLEPRERAGVDPPESLEGDARVALAIVCRINDAHGPGAEASLDHEPIIALEDQIHDCPRD
jgi:hypothetical protein